VSFGSLLITVKEGTKGSKVKIEILIGVPSKFFRV
jgi:hypothetical protein